MLCYEFMELVLMPMYFNILQCIQIDIVVVKNPPAMQEMRRPGFDPWVRKTALEKETATHSSNLACKIPWTGEPGEQSMVSQSWTQMRD